jgi:hypothetical protein
MNSLDPTLTHLSFDYIIDYKGKDFQANEEDIRLTLGNVH